MSDDHDPAAAPKNVPPEYSATFRPADRYGFLERRGTRLRYACWNVPGTAVRGSVVLQQGRAEFIEKYATETVGELLARGYAVYALDWRGQGLSDRPLAERDKGHVDDFAAYLADFRLFLGEIVGPAAPRPVLGLCHSMGAHLVLRHLAEQPAGLLSAAICISPMIGLCRGLAIRSLLAFMALLGRRDSDYMVATGPYDPRQRKFSTNDVTSDERRYRFTDRWCEADPRLALGGPTVGWLRQAFRSMDELSAPGVMERIDVPVLFVGTSTDAVVDAASHRMAVGRIRGAKLVTIDGAKHEILMETDARRAEFWQAFDEFAGAREVR
ncbi:MAG TPA: alpha/beta hydrolase [Reyranella sp.]|nr:alpha/beta hydrolase [Reyranella sp.]